jgi:[acyl-carrier-protein] S-malonyltransferase
MPDRLFDAEALRKRLRAAAFAFRGYNVTNFGRTLELLKHAAYGPVVERWLNRASEICSEASKRPVNLVGRVRRRATSTMGTYPQDLAMIVAVELAQTELLREFFGVEFGKAEFTFGYSLGEVAAIVASGVFEFEAVLLPLLVLAKDAAALAHNVQMGIVFTRARTLDVAIVERLCLHITSLGGGTIGISTVLAPNSVLLLGQGKSVDVFKDTMHDVLPKDVHLRKNPHRWPPIHTPIARQKNISNRAAVMLETAPGGFVKPHPPILSCVTGEANYDEVNSREILTRWVDHPQLLWDVIDELLNSQVETIIHVGPEPNIIPATLDRLSNNVVMQLSAGTWSSYGLRAVSRIARRRPWLSKLISADAALLRAPFVQQIVLEDWLLGHKPN